MVLLSAALLSGCAATVTFDRETECVARFVKPHANVDKDGKAPQLLHCYKLEWVKP